MRIRAVLKTFSILAVALIVISAMPAAAMPPSSQIGEATIRVKLNNVDLFFKEGENWLQGDLFEGESLSARRVNIGYLSNTTETFIHTLPLSRSSSWSVESDCANYGYPDLIWEISGSNQPMTLLLSDVHLLDPFITNIYHDPSFPDTGSGIYISYSGVKFDWEFDPEIVWPITGFTSEERAALLRMSGNQRTATSIMSEDVRVLVGYYDYTDPWDAPYNLEFTQTFSCSELFE